MTDGENLSLWADKVAAVLTLAGFSPTSVGPFDTHPGVEVQLDPNDGPKGALWVRWRSGEILADAAVERFRRRPDDPITSFNSEVRSRMGETLYHLLTLSGFEASMGSNDYSPFDVRVTGHSTSDVIAFADEQSDAIG
jgi:hypothetical protein